MVNVPEAVNSSVQNMLPFVEAVWGSDVRLYLEAVLAIVGAAAFLTKLLPSSHANVYMDKLIGCLHKIGLNPPRHGAR